MSVTGIPFSAAPTAGGDSSSPTAAADSVAATVSSSQTNHSGEGGAQSQGTVSSNLLQTKVSLIHKASLSLDSTLSANAGFDQGQGVRKMFSGICILCCIVSDFLLDCLPIYLPSHCYRNINHILV